MKSPEKSVTTSSQRYAATSSQIKKLRTSVSLPHGPQQRWISFHLPSERINTRATHIQTTGGGGSRRGDSLAKGEPVRARRAGASESTVLANPSDALSDLSPSPLNDSELETRLVRLCHPIRGSDCSRCQTVFAFDFRLSRLPLRPRLVFHSMQSRVS
jgi:hypothetical protein